MTDKSLEAHLYECLKEGNTKKALYIIKLLGDKVNGLYRGKSPLCWAKEFENDEVVRVLEEKRAIEEVVSKEEVEKIGIELVEKAGIGDLDAVIELIEKGADINIKSCFNETALIKASLNGNLEIVERLIEAGADVNLKDRCGLTALMWASRIGYLEIVERLIEAKANVNETDSEGYTAVIMASQYGHLEVVDKLIEKGAKVNQKNDYGKTAMSLARNDEIRKTILDAVKKRKEKAKENEPSFMDRVKGLFGKGE